MPILAEVTQEKQRISEQLAKVDSERSRLRDRLNELEVAERVLSRFGQRSQPQRLVGQAAGPQSKEPATTGQGSRPTARRQRTTQGRVQLLPLGEATLRAVKAHSDGVSADAVRDYLTKHFGLTVRPNHLGMALQRHRRAGRLRFRDSRWYAIQ